MLGKLDQKVFNHPCYTESSIFSSARIHLPVAPRCNMQCNYCLRTYDCANESRPGVSSEILKPREALNRLNYYLKILPQLSVVGIAGPGDPLANPEATFETFKLVRRHFPHLSLCFSTNGLLLPDLIGHIRSLKIEFVTITINMIEPEIGKEIYRWIYFRGRLYKGMEGAKILHEQQIKGLHMLSDFGIFCKVNTVVIPGINEHHIVEIAIKVAASGAQVMNLIPLISIKGTELHKRGVKVPSPDRVRSLMEACQRMTGIKVIQHCQRCRADACGFLLLDHPKDLAKMSQQIPVGCGTRVAVATISQVSVDAHFGQAMQLTIYEFDGENWQNLGPRKLPGRYCTSPITCGDNEEELIDIIETIADCQVLLCRRIGIAPASALRRAGIEPVQTADTIGNALKRIALHQTNSSCQPFCYPLTPSSL